MGHIAPGIYIQKLYHLETSKTAQYQCFSSIKVRLDAGIIIMNDSNDLFLTQMSITKIKVNNKYI